MWSSGEPTLLRYLHDGRVSRVVNLQEPLRRSRFGFDSADHVLDIVVEADLSAWSWKDEDELREAVTVGRFSAEEAELYREGEQAIATLESRAWPFDRDWASWRPEPTWPAPGLVEGGDEL